jgi:quinol monooxygenase YgiN
MLLASLCFRVLPHKRAEGLGAIDTLAGHMRTTTGCSRSRVMNDTDDINAFVLVSEWKDPGDADAFFGSREFQIFKGIRILLRDEPYIVLDDVRTRMTRMIRD